MRGDRIGLCRGCTNHSVQSGIYHPLPGSINHPYCIGGVGRAFHSSSTVETSCHDDSPKNVRSAPRTPKYVPKTTITSGTTSASTKLLSELIPNIWRGIIFFGIVQSCITLSKQKHNRCAAVTESDRYARSTEWLFRNRAVGINCCRVLDLSSKDCQSLV